MTEVDDTDRAVFERALASFAAAPAPVERIRFRARARRMQTLTVRGAALAVVTCVLALGAAFPSEGSAVFAAVRAALFPTDMARIVVLDRRPARITEDLHPARSLAEAQLHVPFAILVPPSDRGWHLQTIVVSDAPRYPSVEMLYRAKNGTWVKIAERPSTAAVSPRDSDLTDLLSSGSGKKRTIGNITLTYPAVIDQRSVVRTYGALRATITVPAADQRSALRVPLVPNRDVTESPVPVFVKPGP